MDEHLPQTPKLLIFAYLDIFQEKWLADTLDQFACSYHESISEFRLNFVHLVHEEEE